MAGQPQEPTWQPGAQDQARAREAWPPPAPTFTPQAGSSQDTFIYPQPTAWGQPERAAPPASPGPGQTAQPGTEQPVTPDYGQPAQPDYARPDYGQPAQPDYAQPAAAQPAPGQGYPPPTYSSPQDQALGQGLPQWQASPGRRPATPRPRGEKGFIGSLFDFSFQSMVTPKIIKVLYILLTAFIGLWALIFTIWCFREAGAVAGLFVLIVLDPIYILLTLGVYRIVLEFVMVTFRLHEDVKAIRAKAEGLS